MKKIVVTLTLALLSQMAFGAIYKCLDADGKISYQEGSCGVTQDATPKKLNQTTRKLADTESQALNKPIDCETFKKIAEQAADFANRGVPLKEAVVSINAPRFNGIINLVYESRDAQERQRTARGQFYKSHLETGLSRRDRRIWECQNFCV